MDLDYKSKITLPLKTKQKLLELSLFHKKDWEHELEDKPKIN